MDVKVEFKYAIEYTHAGLSGQDTQAAIEHWFTDRSAALEAHYQACQGRWVEHGMRRPAVGDLQVVKNGSLLPEALRAGVDLAEVPAPSIPTSSADRAEHDDTGALRAVPATTEAGA